MGCAAISRNEAINMQLPNESSIFSAEASVLKLALSLFESSNHDKFLIFSASLFVLKSMANPNHPNPLKQNILKSYFQVVDSKKKKFYFLLDT